jgi:hypothetical protein
LGIGNRRSSFGFGGWSSGFGVWGSVSGVKGSECRVPQALPSAIRSWEVEKGERTRERESDTAGENARERTRNKEGERGREKERERQRKRESESRRASERGRESATKRESEGGSNSKREKERRIEKGGGERDRERARDLQPRLHKLFFLSISLSLSLSPPLSLPPSLSPPVPLSLSGVPRYVRLTAPGTDRTMRVPSGVPSPVTTNQEAKGCSNSEKMQRTAALAPRLHKLLPRRRPDPREAFLNVYI